MRQAQSVKKGVHQSGGTPREFCTITVTDGIAMGHEGMKSSLISRDVIADSTELTVRGHCYDAFVDPPVAATIVAAFSRDFHETISHGLIIFSNKIITAFPLSTAYLSLLV